MNYELNYMALQIGKYIHFALSQNADIIEVTNGNIFPVVVPDIDNTPTPYIVYWTEGMSEASTKDGIYGDTATVKIMVVAKDYDDKMDILPLIRTAMQEAWSDWNQYDESVRPFTIEDQTMHLDGDEYDIEFGYHTSTFTYTIETATD